MVRRKTAESAENPTEAGYDEQMAARAEAMQNRPEELPVKTGEIIQSVADATRMPESGKFEQPAAATEQPAKKPFQVVRGWTTRNKAPVQYRKLTDADLNTIIFKFVLPKDDEGKERMPADIKDILDAHKRYPETGEPTGLHFENSNKHGKSWVIRNDPEGRAIADKVDFALQKLAAKHDLQAEQVATR
jgi:hypothetical protein